MFKASFLHFDFLKALQMSGSGKALPHTSPRVSKSKSNDVPQGNDRRVLRKKVQFMEKLLQKSLKKSESKLEHFEEADSKQIPNNAPQVGPRSSRNSRNKNRFHGKNQQWDKDGYQRSDYFKRIYESYAVPSIQFFSTRACVPIGGIETNQYCVYVVEQELGKIVTNPKLWIFVDYDLSCTLYFTMSKQHLEEKVHLRLPLHGKTSIINRGRDTSVFNQTLFSRETDRSALHPSLPYARDEGRSAPPGEGGLQSPPHPSRPPPSQAEQQAAPPPPSPALPPAAASSSTGGDYDPSRAVHPRYTDLQRRESSFSQWPDTHAQSPRDLALAGFFFTGEADCVRCHHCGVGLKHWDLNHRPLEEHAMASPWCGYLSAVCDRPYIARVLVRLAQNVEAILDSAEWTPNVAGTDAAPLQLLRERQRQTKRGLRPAVIWNEVERTYFGRCGHFARGQESSPSRCPRCATGAPPAPADCDVREAAPEERPGSAESQDVDLQAERRCREKSELFTLLFDTSLAKTKLDCKGREEERDGPSQEHLPSDGLGKPIFLPLPLKGVSFIIPEAEDGNFNSALPLKLRMLNDEPQVESDLHLIVSLHPNKVHPTQRGADSETPGLEPDPVQQVQPSPTEIPEFEYPRCVQNDSTELTGHQPVQVPEPLRQNLQDAVRFVHERAKELNSPILRDMLTGWQPLFSEITALPVVPRGPEEGLARIDFRSPPRKHMNVEGHRVGTFLFYPSAEQHAVLRLANAGFYCTGENDVLACFCCPATFSYADRGRDGDPYAIHRELNPDCPHLTGRGGRNVFIQDDQTRVQSGRDMAGPASEGSQALEPNVQELVAEAIARLRRALVSYQMYSTSAVPNAIRRTSDPIIGDESRISQSGDNVAHHVRQLRASIIDNVPANRYENRPLFNTRGSRQPGDMPPRILDPSAPAPAAPTPAVPTAAPAAPAPDARAAAQESDNSGRQPAAVSGSAPSQAESGPGTASPSTGGDYDPSRAVHPRYTDLQRRESSFSQWPDTHAQSPRDLALAGFFFTGIEDCVRCHYCGLGLKHWDPDDDPLDEHVRWRSSCGYLRALLGDDVIARTLARLGRRTRGDTSSASEGSESVAAALGSQAPSVSAVSSSASQPGRSQQQQHQQQHQQHQQQEHQQHQQQHQQQQHQQQQREVEELMTSEAAGTARAMGFPDNVIQRAIGALLSTRAGRRAVTPQNLANAILYLQGRGQDADIPGHSDSDDDSSNDSGAEERGPGRSGGLGGGQGGGLGGGQGGGQGEGSSAHVSQGPPARQDATASPPPQGQTGRGGQQPGGGRGAPTSSPLSRGGNPPSTDPPRLTQQDLRRLEQENQELRERRRCKICLDNDVSILFLPCGHLVCCPECAPSLRRCPMCRRRITGTVRIHFTPLPSSTPPPPNPDTRRR